MKIPDLYHSTTLEGEIEALNKINADLLEACKLAKDFIGNGIKIINDHAPSGTFDEISKMHQVLYKAIGNAEA